VAFESGQWTYLAGLWHDLGKLRPEFQRRLAGEPIQAGHSSAGAAFAHEQSKDLGLAIAFAIAGHHGGIPNVIEAAPGSSRRGLKQRLADGANVLQQIRASIPAEIGAGTLPPPPSRFESQKDDPVIRRSFEFWIRFLYSTLVDADYLDTENSVDPKRAAIRSSEFNLEPLLAPIENETRRLSDAAGATPTVLSGERRRISELCFDAAAHPRGLFALTAPTGSGKTLAAMRFALNHAAAWGLQRVVAVLPYTSIIEQNAEVYRELFGAQNVVEHHSNFDLDDYRRDAGVEATSSHMLACENWDAPVIVTTTVQFFESLFSNKPSRCRKLHNIARSVVILDEVQCLPPGLLPPILDGLKELVSNYGCSVLLCTATPPALSSRIGLAVHEILPNPVETAGRLTRVRYQWPVLADPAMDWHALAAKMAAQPQVLTVVHQRKDARLLAELLQESCERDTVFHLSALMCPAHRSVVIGQIKNRLSAGLPCRVVSTQLVEAGVDLDFPVLFRALAGLDSIVQAAGRCNREGSEDFGTVQVFRAPTQPPAGVLRAGLQVMEMMLAARGGALDPGDPAVCEEYFSHLYAVAVRDSKGIQALRQGLNFESVAREFQLIEDGAQASIVVPYLEGALRIGELNQYAPAAAQLRGLQRYTVRVHRHWADRLRAAGALDEPLPGVMVLNRLYKSLYRDDYGLDLQENPLADAAELVC
jgi:CRISPR-associated endonuclease/helicase Cas3